MAVLSLKNVGYTYEKNTKPVFKGLNADFELGKVYCIIGKSGAGKTSLLSLMAGLDTCTEGMILYEGSDLSKLDRDDYRAKKAGIVFQDFNLLHNKSALENLELSMAISGIHHKNNRAYAQTLLADVGIDMETAKRRVVGLSGGEQQRVSIARALSHDPNLLLADEPSGNLDRETEKDVINILVNLAHLQKKCVIIVTHSQKITHYADEIWGLNKGGGLVYMGTGGEAV